LKSGGPNNSIPYFVITPFILLAASWLFSATFSISLPISSKNFSKPPGWQTRVSLASAVVVFAQTCGMPRGSQMPEPAGRLCDHCHLHRARSGDVSGADRRGVLCAVEIEVSAGKGFGLIALPPSQPQL
jgi:hypothetical protein